jgi:hypothetical protein
MEIYKCGIDKKKTLQRVSEGFVLFYSAVTILTPLIPKDPSAN